ncbi:hypothetical protein F4801DRAFT_553814 [Xylaria longipes]|nr:hypothetical protein F4801DRAFT_553814 [Xylaria longipes]
MVNLALSSDISGITRSIDVNGIIQRYVTIVTRPQTFYAAATNSCDNPRDTPTAMISETGVNSRLFPSSAAAIRRMNRLSVIPDFLCHTGHTMPRGRFPISVDYQ